MNVPQKRVLYTPVLDLAKKTFLEYSKIGQYSSTGVLMWHVAFWSNVGVCFRVS